MSQPRRRPHPSGHVRDRYIQKGITPEAVEFVCGVAAVDDYDEVNESYKLKEWVAGGHLCVAIEAKAYDDRGQFVVKTAYWIVQAPPR